MEPVTTLQGLSSSPAKYLALFLPPGEPITLSRSELGTRAGLQAPVVSKALGELREAGLLDEAPFARGKRRPFVYLGVALPHFRHQAVGLEELRTLTPAQRAVYCFLKGGGRLDDPPAWEVLGLAYVTVQQALQKPAMQPVRGGEKRRSAALPVTLTLSLPAYLASWLKDNEGRVRERLEDMKKEGEV